ncbi:MAG TPA: cysteine peptidase family C39 domain-containing protein, partial [Chitinophagaceae bacterium]
MDIIIQHDQMDCGPACLAMICSHYGKKYTLQYLRENSFITREGVSLLGMTEAAQKIGFDTIPAKLTLESLYTSAKAFPCILHWEQKHFVVLVKIKRRLGSDKLVYVIADPAHGYVSLNEQQFKNAWQSDGEMGVALFLTPKDTFGDLQPPAERRITLTHILNYLRPYKRQMLLVFALLLLGSCIMFVFPFLTQRLIDQGVNGKNLNVITVILLAQLVLYTGSITIEIIRNWLTLLVGTKISIHVISEYLKKILQLPLKFFDSKRTGDFNQRILDNQRIEDFLTSQSLT